MHWGKEKMAGGGIARHAPLEEVDKRESEVVLVVQAVVMPGQMVPPLPFRNAVNTEVFCVIPLSCKQEGFHSRNPFAGMVSVPFISPSRTLLHHFFCFLLGSYPCSIYTKLLSHPASHGSFAAAAH